MSDTTSFAEEHFELGEPALVCRWRIAGGALPMENRHMRALGQRSVAGKKVPVNLVSWAKQHIEWDLADGTRSVPDGVLMLVVDKQLHAAMSAGPYEELVDTHKQALIGRAIDAAAEQNRTGVAPETLWVLREGTLFMAQPTGSVRSASCSLVADVAQTLGVDVKEDEELWGLLEKQIENRQQAESCQEELVGSTGLAGEVFLASDEHGVVVAQETYAMLGENALLERLVKGYERLLDVTRQKARR